MIDGFLYSHGVEGRASIADLFPPDKRCGLYILRFTNGEVYAGQAVDVTRRYAQHRKVHADIQEVSFKQVDRHRLDDEERALIWLLEERGYRLRNITFTSLPKGESDFDLIMFAKDQGRWLKDLDYVDSDGSRIVDPELRRKYSRKVESFAALSRSGEVVDFLRYYVRVGIPAFLRGEVSFWCVSCVPKPDVYSRINVYWQEVLTVFTVDSEIWVSLHMADSPFTSISDESLDLLFKRHPALQVTDHRYGPGGPDQVNLTLPLAAARTFISDLEVLPAIRLFNLRLMQKGPCNFGRFHCMDLADRLVSSQPT